MQVRFVRSLFFLLLLNLLVKPFWFLVIDRGVQNTVGTSVYGPYYALLGLSFYLQIILDPGLHTYNNQSLVKQPQQLSEYLSSFIPLKLILSLIYIVFTIVLALFFGYKGQELNLLIWICASQVLSSLLLYLRSNLTGLYLFNMDSIFSVLDRLFMIIICSVLLWGHLFSSPFHIEWFVYAQVFSLLLACVLASLVIFRRANFFRPQIHPKSFYNIILKNYPFALLGILMALYTRIDSMMVERLLPDGAYHAGVYASAYRILEAANMIAFLFANILLPVFTGLIHKNESVASTSRLGARLLLVPGFILVLVCFYFRFDITTLLYKDATPYWGNVFGWLMIGFPALCMVYIYGTLLTANGSLRFLNYTAAIGVAGNILLNFFLIPHYQALGAVIATLITQYFVSLAHIRKSYVHFKLKTTRRELARILLFIAFAWLSFYLFNHVWAKWWINLVVLSAINITFALLIGLFQLRYFKNLLKFKAE